MTWGEANHIHKSEGHSVFIQKADDLFMSGTFKRNVCTNQKCKEF